ncbi:MAG: hypothetical protein ACWA5T_05095, partial [Parvularcula sp.]
SVPRSRGDEPIDYIPAADYAEEPHAHAIATAAVRLGELRQNWLSSSDLMNRVPEVGPGYPDRAVASAYGGQANFDAGAPCDDEILKRLFELNQERTKKRTVGSGIKDAC